MNWKLIKRDLKERFLNSETARGLFLIPAGLISLYVTIFQLQFAIQVVFSLGAIYLIYDGIRKTFVNRIKQKVVRNKLVEERINATKTN